MNDFIKIPRDFIMLNDLNIKEKMVYIILANLCPVGENTCQASIKTEIARQAGVTPNTIATTLKSLEGKGYIDIREVRDSRNAKLPNKYTLLKYIEN